MSFAAEAQIARELMKFAANGTLYRGSKPVMWSVVEKTALAEAEVEYEDYAQDQVWVKFPVAFAFGERFAALEKAYRGARSSSGPRRPGPSRATARSAFAEDRLWPVRVTDAPADNWAKVGRPADPRRQACGRSVQAGACDRVREAAGGAGRRSRGARVRASTERSSRAATSSSSRCSQATTSRTMPAPASCTPRPATAARTSTSGPRTRASSQPRHRHRDPLHGRRERRVHRPRAGLHRQARHPDKGKKGDANEAVIKALAEAGSCRARSAQAPVSAFVALQEAVIFRNTPQWFIAMDRTIAAAREAGDTLRRRALDARSRRPNGPAAGENRSPE